jgi:ADP-ribose pyrophosphatase
VLIVAVNADASVREWKGEGYPIQAEDERAELLAGFGCVDYVFVFEDPSVDRLLELIRPDAYCKGPEYTLDNLPEADTVRRLGIRYCNVGDPKDHSSTSLAERVAEAHDRRTTGAPPQPAVSTSEVEIIDERRVFDGFLSMDEVRLRHATPDGAMSPPMVRQNVERGDGAAVLVVNTTRDVVVLTRQFRYAVWKRRGDGRTLEVPAGTVAADGDPEAVARAEAAEEVGYDVGEMNHVCTFFASPGTTTERVILFEAEVTDDDRLPDRGGGLPEEHEYIEIVEMPAAEAIARMRSGEITDVKTVLGLMMLAHRREHADGIGPDL